MSSQRYSPEFKDEAVRQIIGRGPQAGFTDYLIKPLDIGHVMRVVDEVLGPQTDAD